jgi:hypothetical protein
MCSSTVIGLCIRRSHGRARGLITTRGLVALSISICRIVRRSAAPRLSRADVFLFKWSSSNALILIAPRHVAIVPHMRLSRRVFSARVSVSARGTASVRTLAGNRWNSLGSPARLGGRRRREYDGAVGLTAAEMNEYSVRKKQPICPVRSSPLLRCFDPGTRASWSGGEREVGRHARPALILRPMFGGGGQSRASPRAATRKWLRPCVWRMLARDRLRRMTRAHDRRV